MPTKMSAYQEKKFNEAIKERQKLYDQLHDLVNGGTCTLTKGVGWYKEKVGKVYNIAGVQNFDRVPHFKITEVEVKVGNMSLERYLQWDHCTVKSAVGEEISVRELCLRIKRNERIITD